MTSDTPESFIRAAGGLVVRGDTPQNLEIALVHRPRYDDWSLPKGKCEAGEDLTSCARREIHEETGLVAGVVEKVGSNLYPTVGGRKRVDYFLMRPHRNTGFAADDEVDRVEWLTPALAAEKVSYPFDRDLIEKMDQERAVSQTTLYLVRHAHAGDRHHWADDDRLRPLTAKGTEQSRALAEELSEIGVSRIISSPFTRCIETVEPLAARLGVKVETDDRLAESAATSSIGDLLDELAGSNTVVCSHGDVIPEMLRLLRGRGVQLESPLQCQKGSTWAVTYDGAYRSAFYFPTPNGIFLP